MKTPVVTVMRTQGARRRHQLSIRNHKVNRWEEASKNEYGFVIRFRENGILPLANGEDLKVF